MEVENYTEQTRKSIEEFIKNKGQAIANEIVRLGTTKRVVNWQTFKLIMEDLRVEGLVRETQIGNRVILYEWLGGKNGI